MHRLIVTAVSALVVLLGIGTMGHGWGAPLPLSAAGPYYKTLTGTDFHTLDSDTVTRFASGTGGGIWIRERGFVTAALYLEAGVDLPEGAQVSEVTFYVRNCETFTPPAIYFGAYAPAAGGFSYAIAETPVPAVFNCGTTQALVLTSGLPVTVANGQNRYVVGYRQGTQYQVDSYTPGTVTNLLVGARVAYQTPGAFLPVIQR